jgi:Fe-S cluster biogenesis protein NfuA
MTTETTPAASTDALLAEIDVCLDEMRPYVHSHGGELNLIDWEPEEGRLRLQLAGSCHGCPMSMVTMKLGIERIVQDRFPQVKIVEAVKVDDFDYPDRPGSNRTGACAGRAGLPPSTSDPLALRNRPAMVAASVCAR